MKTLGSLIIFGRGFVPCFGSPARAQWEGMGESAKKDAADAALAGGAAMVVKRVMRGSANQLAIASAKMKRPCPTR